MLCTKCSRPILPVVAIDIDGTLGDYHGHFIEFAEAYLGHSLPRDYDGVGEFSDSLGIPKATYREVKLAYRQGGGKRCMPVDPFAYQLMYSLRTQAEVFITTTRPYLRLDSTDPDTRHWLQRHRIQYDGLLYDEDKYTVLAGIVHPDRVVAVLDDLKSQLDSAERQFGPVGFLRRNHWNRGLIHERTVFTLREAELYIIDRINKWKEQHA
jgi:hypothetical protein